MRKIFSFAPCLFARATRFPCGERLLILSLILIAARPDLGANPIDRDHRAYLVAHLEMTREFVLDATRGLTAEQWLHHPGPKQWSTAQCIEHLARTEEYVLQLVRERLLPAAAPVVDSFPSISQGRKQATEQAEPMGPTEDAWVLRWITDRPRGLNAPAEVAPPAVIEDPRAALAHFLKVRTATLDYVRTTEDDLRAHSANASMTLFPQMKFTDCYQWLLRMSGHTERHLMQIHEIRRSAGYPASAPVR